MWGTVWSGSVELRGHHGVAKHRVDVAGNTKGPSVRVTSVANMPGGNCVCRVRKKALHAIYATVLCSSKIEERPGTANSTCAMVNHDFLNYPWAWVLACNYPNN
jgi:hypothetical protein